METLVNNNLLVRYGDDDPPTDAYIIYDMRGGKYYVRHQRYKVFQANYLDLMKNNTQPTHLTMDLNRAIIHNIVLDVDLKYPTDMSGNNKINALQTIHHYVKVIAINALRDTFHSIDCYTVICARRPRGGGLHFYLPEIVITNDDYVILLETLRPLFHETMGQISFELDTKVQNFNLAYSRKPGCPDPYDPYLVFYIDYSNVCELNMQDSNTFAHTAKNTRFKRKKGNENVLFRMLATRPYEQAKSHALGSMMPVIDNNLLRRIEVCYPTSLRTCEPDPATETCVGQIRSRTGPLKYIVKGRSLRKARADFRFIHNHLSRNWTDIAAIETESPPITRWWRQFQKLADRVYRSHFNSIDDRLVAINPRLGTIESPLKTVLEFSDGLYFVPAFYTLCNTITSKNEYRDLINELRKLLTNERCSELLTRFSEIEYNVVAAASTHFTLRTIEYCACNLYEGSINYDELCKYITDLFSQRIASCRDEESMSQLIQQLFDMYVPFEPSYDDKYFWSCVNSQWQRLSKAEELRSSLNALIFKIKHAWMKQFQDTPSKPKFPLNEKGSLYDVVLSKCLSKEDNLPLDEHKWTLSLQKGYCICLLTGHVFRRVPELYLTKRCVSVLGRDRQTIQRLVDNTLLRKVFQILWSNEFLNEYLEYLYRNVSGSYVDNLKCMLVDRDLPVIYDSECEQMLRFYVHVCKFLCFRYEEMSYLMHAMASCLVATNYAKHLYFVHGNKDNGKSKLFEMLKNVFGSLTGPINSNSLCVQGSKRDTQPDIAIHIFCTRVMLAEELGGKVDQNLLKMLSGNSEISTRALYENSRHGVPTAKIWISTNDPPNCTTTEAFSERVIPFNFRATFSKAEVPEPFRDQIEQCLFKGEQSDQVTNGSKLGMFLHMMYLHFFKFNRETGFLEHPPTPATMLEFKKEYLHCTDLYNQFKTFADVQLIHNETTSQSELETAVRKFMVTWKLKNIRESDIINRFKKEFKSKEVECMYDDNLDDNDRNDDDDDDDDDDLFGDRSSRKRVAQDGEPSALKRLERAQDGGMQEAGVPDVEAQEEPGLSDGSTHEDSAQKKVEGSAQEDSVQKKVEGSTQKGSTQEELEGSAQEDSAQKKVEGSAQEKLEGSAQEEPVPGCSTWNDPVPGCSTWNEPSSQEGTIQSTQPGGSAKRKRSLEPEEENDERAAKTRRVAGTTLIYMNVSIKNFRGRT